MSGVLKELLRVLREALPEITVTRSMPVSGGEFSVTVQIQVVFDIGE
jgi:hypothetical protein